MIPKATEDTITSLFKDELEKLGVKVEQFPIINTPVGVRKPDLLCTNAGSYPVEAKFIERELINAVAKVQNDYLNYHDVLGVKGGFALLYPEELARQMPVDVVKDYASRLKFKAIAMLLYGDERLPFSVYEGRIQEIAKVVAGLVLAPPTYVEPSVDYIIKSLRDSAMYIRSGLRHLAGRDLEGFFGGKDVFKNILQYEEGKYPVEELRFAAAYLLVNQLLFYHVLSKQRPRDFQEIKADRVDKPSDLLQYFRSVLDVNYRPVFSYNVASLIPPRFSDEVRTIINVVKGLSPEGVGGDLLGTIFHDLIPFEVRKNVAAFYTNVLAAELLASLSIDRPDLKVADLAVGSGGLLVAAYRRKKSLKGTFSYDDHRRFVEEELLGVDVMPFAASVAACHLALQSPEYFTDRVKIAVWDSTDLEPSRAIPSVAGLRAVLTGQTFLDTFTASEHEAKGVVSLGEERPEEIKLENCGLVIMNPPFTRQERFPEEYKQILSMRFNDYEKYLHGQLGYHGYFVLLADRFLDEEGRVALVLPATILRVRSCEGLRRLWSEKYHVEHIITTWHRSAFSESVRFREMLFVARKSEFDNDAKTTITVLKRLPNTLTEAREVADRLKHSQTDSEDDKISVKIHNYSKLKADTSNWFKYVAVSDLSLIDLMEQLLQSDKLIPFSSIAEAQRIDLEHLKFKDFHGFILHDESRAQKRIDVWVFDRLKKDALVTRHRQLGWETEVPLNVLGRGLRRLSYVDTMDVSDTSDYLTLSWFSELKDMAKAALTNKELSNFKRSTVEAWREKFDDRRSHVLLARRLNLSAPGTSLLAFYSDSPVVGVDMWCIRQVAGNQAKILTLWLNSTLSILQTLILRTETEGAWMKIHDYMLDELLAPNQDKLSEGDIELLMSVFEKVKDMKLPSILTQLQDKHPARRLVDEAWLNILGYKGDVDRLLDKLYGSLASEIGLLKELMAEGEAGETIG